MGKANFLSIVLFFFGALAGPISADPGFSIAPVKIEVKSLPVSMGEHLEYFEDETGKLTLADILDARNAPAWSPTQQQIPSFGVKSTAFWFRTQLDVSEYENQMLYLVIHFPALDHADVTILNGGVVAAHRLMGDVYPEPSNSRLHIMPFYTSSAARLDVYIQTKNLTAMELPLTIMTPTQLLLHEQAPLLLEGGFNAMLLLLIVVSSALAIISRSSFYGAYALLFFAQLMVFLPLRGVGRIWVWPTSELWNTRASALALALTLLAMGWIGLQVIAKEPRKQIFRVCSVVIMLLGAFAGTYSFFRLDQFLVVLGFGLGLTMPLYGAWLSVVMIRPALAGDYFSRLFIVSWGFFLGAYLFQIVSKLGVIERSVYTEYLFQVGVGFSALVMLVSLLERVRQQQSLTFHYQAVSKAKTEFLAKMSHDLRTPLNSILGFSQLLLKKRKDDEAFQREALETIHRNGKHLLLMVNDILDMEKIESGCLALHMEEVRLSDLLQQLLPPFSLAAQEKNLSFTSRVDDSVEAITTDGKRLAQVINNLLSNAVKYTLQGSIEFSLRAQKMSSVQGIEFRVKDTGIGISDNDKKRLFQRYLRAGDERVRNIEGTGLGLLITSELVRELGGRIDYTSKLNQGSEFVVTLPLRHPSVAN